jgi:hypothetical protein
VTLINSNIEATNRRRASSRTVGSYAVLELLGSGAFGSVYKVLHACIMHCILFYEPFLSVSPGRGC